MDSSRKKAKFFNSITYNASGFTLIELAIALMVIGLLIGGVLKGQELIQNARLTQVVRQVGSYRTAVMIFHSSYGGLPGDFRGGSRVPGCTAAPCTTAGNGNGVLDPVGAGTQWNGMTTNRPFWNAQPENRNFWRHLYLANIITGVRADNATSSPFEWGFEYPASPMDGAGFAAHGNIHTLRNGVWLVPAEADRSAMHARNAANIDRKMDDGMPWTGDVIIVDDHYSGRAWRTNCVATTTGTAPYNEGASADGCSLFFYLN